jgi:hypothetical protein
MRWIESLAALLAMSAPGFAQESCPYQRAEEVPVSYRIIGSIQCTSGISLNVQGINVRKEQVCPQTIIVTPTHDRSIPSERATYTEVEGQLPEKMLTFACNMGWFLIIPTGDECEQVHTMDIGSVRQLKTLGCVDRPDPTTE